jgi:hypothetical protein
MLDSLEDSFGSCALVELKKHRDGRVLECEECLSVEGA